MEDLSTTALPAVLREVSASFGANTTRNVSMLSLLEVPVRGSGRQGRRGYSVYYLGGWSSRMMIRRVEEEFRFLDLLFRLHVNTFCLF